MKIKEVEQIVGLAKENIRYYEKEGLIKPERNDNNYREYSLEDSKRLKKIKFLRELGISISDIKKVIHYPDMLSLVLEKRKNEINREKEELKKVAEICTELIASDLSFDALSEEFITGKESILKKELQHILRADTVKIKISQKTFNHLIMGLLIYSFVLHIIICSFFDFKWTGVTAAIAAAYVILSFASLITTYMTENLIILSVSFHVLLLSLALLLLAACSEPQLGLRPLHIIASFFFLIAFVLLNRIFMTLCKNYFNKLSGIIILNAIFIATTYGILYAYNGWSKWIVFALWGIALYISIVWKNANNGVRRFNLYYCWGTGTKMFAIAAILISGQAFYSDNWRRGE